MYLKNLGTAEKTLQHPSPGYFFGMFLNQQTPQKVSHQIFVHYLKQQHSYQDQQLWIFLIPV